jgi:alkaline phosphatase
MAILSILIMGLNLVVVSAAPVEKPKKPLAKNIIILISDGWGYKQITSTSYYVCGKDARQTYNRFPVKYAMSTYMVPGSYDPNLAWASFDYVKSGATDSAAAATAMSTGIKTYGGAIGVDLAQQPLEHLLEVAEENGKATGVVSSVEFSHATPAAFVAHNVSRNNYAEIANEMIYESAADVIMGAGHPCYSNDAVYNGCMGSFKYVGGPLTWAELEAGTAGGDADGDGKDDPWTLIETREEFQALMSGTTPKRIIGVPHVYQTLQYNRTAAEVPCHEDPVYGTVCEEPYPYFTDQNEGVPTLEEMTKAALNVLDDDPDGLFLMIEGGAVDWAGHGNSSARVIEEQIDFDNSVDAVIDWVNANSNWGETLVVVTGDHETGYLNGPVSDPENPTWQPIVNNGAGNLPGMGWHSGGHTNQLIPFFAKGDAARLFRDHADQWDAVHGRYIDNTEIADVVFEVMEP